MSTGDLPKASLERVELLADALHTQLLVRRRATLEHDIKNVVHGLLSGTELLAKSLSTTSARISPNECLALLQQQLGRVQTTLNRMLEEVAPSAVEPTEIELAALVDDCTHALRHQLQSFPLRNLVERGPKIRVHPSRCKDALMSILLNCIDRSARSGIELAMATTDERLTLRIQYSLRETESADDTYFLSELLAGDAVHLDAATNGTQRTIEVSFPRLAAAAETETANRTVLVIVDGNRDAADSAAMLAQLEGIEAIASYDNDSAVAVVKSRRPAAVLLDLDGSIDAGVLVRTVRAENPRVRLIGISYSNASGGEADAYVRKPLDISALRKALEGTF